MSEVSSAIVTGEKDQFGVEIKMYIEILKRVTEICLHCLKIGAKKAARVAPVKENGVPMA